MRYESYHCGVQQMQFAAPGMMPFAVSPGQMPPGYMMVPNPAMMAGQQMMHGFGFPPGMAPMPMMAHGQVGQPGEQLSTVR